MGFVIIVAGLIMVYVGITGSQHNLMATLKGSTNIVKSGKAINPSGSGSDTSGSATENPFPAQAA